MFQRNAVTLVLAQGRVLIPASVTVFKAYKLVGGRVTEEIGEWPIVHLNIEGALVIQHHLHAVR